LDVKKRFSEEQIIGFLREADRGVPVKELSRKHGIAHVTLQPEIEGPCAPKHGIKEC